MDNFNKLPIGKSIINTFKQLVRGAGVWEFEGPASDKSYVGASVGYGITENLKELKERIAQLKALLPKRSMA